MAIWDDIKKAFEDLGDYMKQGVDYVVYGVNMAEYGISYAAREAWKHTSEAARTVDRALAEVHMTISQGLTDGVNISVAFLEKSKKAFDDFHDPPPPPDEKTVTKEYFSKAIGALFMRMAQEGEEYDLYRLLSIVCDEKKLDAIEPVSYTIAERLGKELHHIPLIGKRLPTYYIVAYLWHAITKAATENPEKMGGGKAGQVIAGLTTVLITELMVENNVMEDFPYPNDPKGYDVWQDPVDTSAPTVWPEGSRIRVDSDIYLVLDGKVRHIPGTEVFNRLLENWDGVIASMDNLQTIGPPLPTNAYLASAQGDGKVYLVCDGVKRWISSPQVFKKYNFNSTTIRQKLKAEIEAIPTGDTLYNFTRKEGSVLRMGTGAGLYLLLDKKARPIPSKETFNQLFANWNRIQEVNMHLVELGDAIADGAFLASAGGRAYFINGGEKRWIMNPVAFNSFNFDWNKIKQLHINALDHYNDGPPIY